ncbi:MEDS domain-containing protein [Cryptosporangium aurantiacum]|uniref:Anti-sigma regulatory factor (Ser/Thr protein kinase) n=1 Tax=Cryptosporangium aurantiacum TaxID=134849 RepID=A0A1M7TX03_9ACTN|nr:MEDS domain-containing protein [Cryptosporangium aurantiacum]SHN75133.1 Anti-sigma regulatory factor (Ser/Thr protein kinase) [Cryptosporangium aurantiacum]
MTAAHSTGTGFDHAALIVDSDDTVQQLLVPVLRRHATDRTPVLLVVGPHTERVLRAELGPVAETLEWGTPDAFYQRLGFAFANFRQYLREQHAQGRSVHVIAEPDVATDLEAPVDRVAAYLSYESMCNDVYAAYGCPITCIWDSRRHPTLVIENVRSIHDHELTVDGRLENDGFIPTDRYLDGRADVTMPPAPEASDLDLVIDELDELTGCRAAISAWATEHGFADLAAKQVSAAASEVLTNGLRHGRPPVRVRTWHHDKTLVVHVEDRGGTPIPADAGYRPPLRPGDGMGLWVARQFADVLLTHTDVGCTAVRLYFPYGVTHRGLDVDEG